MDKVIKNAYLKYFVVIFAFMLSVFYIGSSEKVSCAKLSGEDISKTKIVVERYTYEYGYGSVNTNYATITYNDANIYNARNMLEANTIYFQIGAHFSSEITYNYSSYKINVDTFDYNNINFSTDIIGVNASTGTNQNVSFYIYLYSETQDILKFVSDNENVYDILRNSFKSIIENDTTKSFDKFEDGYTFGINDYSYVLWKSLWRYENDDFTMVLTLPATKLSNINFTRDGGFVINKLQVLSFEDAINGGSSGYSEEEYLEYGETKYQEGKDSVDITTDNQSYADKYIEDNNYHTNEEYLSYGDSKYQEGKDSVDITTDNQSYADKYIEDNNYHTNEEYLSYGETKYQEGKDSVDITTDNQDYADKYIKDNKYHTHQDYQNYGYTRYNDGLLDGMEMVDITTDNQDYADKYIKDNNYHTNEEYLSYGETKYQEGKDSVDITTDNQSYVDKYIKDNNYHAHQEYLEYGDSKYQEGIYSVDITIDNQIFVDKYIKDNNYKNEVEFKEYGNKQYKLGYKDNSIKKHVGSFFNNLGDILFGWLIK